MANVPPIPSGTRPRSEVPAALAGRPRPAAGIPFRALLARGQAGQVASGAPAPRTEVAAPRRQEEAGGGALVTAAGDEERARRPVSERDSGDDLGGHLGGVDPLDPMTRALFSDGQRLVFERSTGTVGVPNTAPQVDTAALAARVSLEHVMSRFVRRVAWSGDAQTG